jgi:formamidopyrimidine-DNA glycosylase
MPELPEVETIVRDLRKEVLHRTFIDIWTDAPNMIKKETLTSFKKKLIGKEIIGVRRRAKNILIDLSGDSVLLIHQKIAGHLLFGKWRFEKNHWIAEKDGPLLTDPINNYIHVVFILDNKTQIVLSDARKFAKIELWNKSELESSDDFLELGPEPLDDNFTFSDFKKLFEKKKGKIKQVLMDQSFIAGIGNIYASEILFKVRIHPEEEIKNLDDKDIKKIYDATREILEKAIDLKGDSFSDFRTLYGEKGGAQGMNKVYQKDGKPCPKCGGMIKRITQGGRGTFFCPKCQIKR